MVTPYQLIAVTFRLAGWSLIALCVLLAMIWHDMPTAFYMGFLGAMALAFHMAMKDRGLI